MSIVHAQLEEDDSAGVVVTVDDKGQLKSAADIGCWLAALQTE
jgi:hypothetical protein